MGASWSAQNFRQEGDTPSGPAAFLIVRLWKSWQTSSSQILSAGGVTALVQPRYLDVFDFPVSPGIWYSAQLVSQLPPSFFNIIQIPVWARRGQRRLLSRVEKTNRRMLMVPWKLGFHSAWQQSSLLSKGTYSSMVVLGVAGQRLWERPGRTVFLHFLPWHHPKASLPQCFADRVYRDWDGLYIPLASIWKADH